MDDSKQVEQLARAMMDAARAGEVEQLLPLLPIAPINMQDQAGNTMLMLAAYHGHMKLVEILINHGAELDLLNDRGQTSLAGAVFKGHKEIAKLLFSAGANPNLGTPSAIETAKFFEREEFLKLLEN